MDEHLEYEIEISYQRLLPRLQTRFADELRVQPEIWQVFLERLKAHFGQLFQYYYQLYSNHYDFFFHLEDLLIRLAEKSLNRPEHLRELDLLRESNPNWFQENTMLAGVCYADLFAGSLEGIRAKIPYFQELGLTYLHIMPIYAMPEGENDGGYAVSSYRDIRPDIGTNQDLVDLARDLHRAGISLALDLVINHTSNEHAWAKAAVGGDREYEQYYWMFPDRHLPDAYETHLREIFPDKRSGAFTYQPEIEKWVWTTFHSYQWDLNYSNPAVFNQMASELLYLANIGVEVLRLDAIAFTWKQLGTSCENLPEVHWLIKAYNAAARIAAPALLFKSEAIVHPDEVVRYIAKDECPLSYNPLLMAMLWNSLATRKVRLLNIAMRSHPEIPSDCSWVNYVRVHDDIGWTFSDEDAASIQMHGGDHRRFLNEFYTGRFPGSFARGLPFQENYRTGDARISGSCASLAGLEKALTEETDVEVELAVRRIILIHGVIMTIGGIPLIYLGDEIGKLNDYSYREDPTKAVDNRWVHRSSMDWERAAKRHQSNSIEGRIYNGIKKIVTLRKRYPVFSGNRIEIIETANHHVFGFLRTNKDARALVLANFSEDTQEIDPNVIRIYGLDCRFNELLRGEPYDLQSLQLEPYGLYIFVPSSMDAFSRETAADRSSS